MKRELVINEKKIKELVSNALGKKYEDIKIEYNDHDDLILEVKEGHFIEQIPFTDKRILQALNLDMNFELDDVSIIEWNGYDPFNVNTTDEQKDYIFSCIEKCEA